MNKVNKVEERKTVKKKITIMIIVSAKEKIDRIRGKVNEIVVRHVKIGRE